MSGLEASGPELGGLMPNGGDWIVAFLACAWIALREALHRRRRAESRDDEFDGNGCNEGGRR